MGVFKGLPVADLNLLISPIISTPFSPIFPASSFIRSVSGTGQSSLWMLTFPSFKYWFTSSVKWGVMGDNSLSDVDITVFNVYLAASFDPCRSSESA